MYMLRRRQAVGEDNSEDFDGCYLLDAREGCGWVNFNFPAFVAEDYPGALRWADFKVISFGRLLDTVDLCLAGVDIAGWYDDVSVVSELHKFISWLYVIALRSATLTT